MVCKCACACHSPAAHLHACFEPLTQQAEQGCMLLHALLWSTSDLQPGGGAAGDGLQACVLTVQEWQAGSRWVCAA